MRKQFWVYILASKRNGTLYIGITSDLIRRVWEHKNDVIEGFTKQYGVHMLAWFEEHATAENAIRREKRLKKYNRERKINLIKERNPRWKDLYEEICK